MSEIQDYLEHYGVLGMKWGKRKDTSRGSSSKTRESKKKKKPQNLSREASIARKLKEKKVEEMTNEEIRTLVNRMRLEQDYKTITARKKRAGEKIAGEILLNAAKQTATSFVSARLSEGINLGYQKALEAARIAKDG